MLIEPREAKSSFRDFPRNRLLAALPDSDLATLRPQLELVAIRRGTVLQEFHRPQEDVFFIESGLASLQVQTQEDSPIEAGLVGRMGMIGAPVVLGTAHAPIRGVMEISGEALRLSASGLKALMNRSTSLRRLLLRYIQAATVQTAQLVLCSARHDIDQRVARWLLLAHDRLDGDEIPITHDSHQTSANGRSRLAPGPRTRKASMRPTHPMIAGTSQNCVRTCASRWRMRPESDTAFGTRIGSYLHGFRISRSR
jgi:CRP-like cAMP-binding protein